MNRIKALLYRRLICRLITVMLFSGLIGATIALFLFVPVDAQTTGATVDILNERSVATSARVQELERKVDEQNSQISTMKGIGIGVSFLFLVIQIWAILNGRELDQLSKEIAEHGRKD